MAAAELNLCQSDLVTKYQRILDKNGIDERVERVKLTQPSLKGEQFASVCLYITLDFVSGRKRELFIKQLPTNETHLMFLKEMRLFHKEAGFFNTLLPAMQAYAKQAGQSPMDFFAKCVHADETEIIFENLVTEKGYYLVPKTERQNLEQAEMMLKNLAAFHAVGYCMISEEGGPKPFLDKYPFIFETVYIETNPMLGSMFENALATACDLLANNKVPGGDASLAGLSDYKGKVVPLMCNIAGPSGEHLFHVVNHGDCWNNNMLFRNDPVTGKVQHGVFVDLQVVRIASPVVDILYYMCTSTQTPIRRKNWSNLLKLYFETLKTAVERLSPAAGFPFTLEQFKAEVRSKFSLGFFINLSMTVIADIMAKVDFGSMAKDSDPNEYFKGILNDWIGENPDKAEAYTKEIVELWNEFEEVTK